MEDAQKLKACSENRWHSHGVFGANGTVVYKAQEGEKAEKRMFKFDEQSHHLIENKGSAKRTKPNKPNF